MRQQLAIFKQVQPRPRLTGADRAFWVLLRRFWSKWSNALIIVSPDTVVRWHRKGFRIYWDALSRKGRRPAGRPCKDREIRELIRRMVAENPTWQAPRIHAELLKLGFDVARAHRWLDLIERGDYANGQVLAKALGVDASYVHRFLRITLLRPDIIEDLLHNREPEGMSIEKLRQIPEVWAEQDGVLDQN